MSVPLSGCELPATSCCPATVMPPSVTYVDSSAGAEREAVVCPPRPPLLHAQLFSYLNIGCPCPMPMDKTAWTGVSCIVLRHCPCPRMDSPRTGGGQSTQTYQIITFWGLQC
jgi:hypothetical protein